jgi:hypothetical protein
MRAGEFVPALSQPITQPVPDSCLVIGVTSSEWDDESFVYRTRFENLLGERFEVSNYPDPTRPATFRHVL